MKYEYADPYGRWLLPLLRKAKLWKTRKRGAGGVQRSLLFPAASRTQVPETQKLLPRLLVPRAEGLSRNGPAGPSAGNGRPVLMMAGQEKARPERDGREGDLL